MSTGSTAEPQFVPPRPTRPRWPWGVAVPVVVALLVFGGLRVFGSDDSCGGGTRSGPSHECIGVSDSYAYEDSLKSVMKLIEAENDRVDTSGKKWVSVAYVLPITTDLEQEALKYDTKEELEGAYLAQLRLNDPDLGGNGDTPQIKLLVANVGLRSEQWQPLAERLIAMTKGDHPLVGVAGFGQSRGGTLSLVNELRAAKVPMMGATVTADKLASATDVGFFRTAPPNVDQASAAARHLKAKQQSTPGYDVLVVRDRNTDDIYNTSLYSDFVSAAKRERLTLVEGDQDYISGVDGISNAFASVANGVCAKRPEAVFFAGRGANLRNFITAMSAPARRCQVTVLTGDDAVGVYPDRSLDEANRKQFESNWRNSKVTALYTALGHPALPGRLYDADHNPLPGFTKLYHDTFGQTDGDMFEDGQVILAHDAVWTLGAAVRAAAGETGTAPVTPGSVLSALVSLADVQGISGKIDLGSDGNPQDKAMALVQLEPDRRFVFNGVIRPG
ncbi:ABC transporter substrate-binding protein [Streptomyces sp.]|uniref:ABC transporter substrate-binding protein n=1 Tax=Streptomyces sp. TaxID=1931 RepID=UPI002F40350F